MNGAGFVKLAGAAAVGACLAYLFDPDRGRSRRARLGDQLSATARRDARALGRRVHYERGRVEGVRHRVSRSEHAPPASDQVILDKVRSEVLGREREIAHHISVDVSKGVVTLRGELGAQDDIARLEKAVRRISGVEDVANLVHLPGEVAPNKAAALRVV